MGDDGMTTNRSVRRAFVAAGALLVVAAPAFAADSLSDSVEQFLDRTQRTLEENKIWKLQIKPELRESVIWTDNIFLNDAHEQGLRLLETTDPRPIRVVEGTLRDFANA